MAQKNRKNFTIETFGIDAALRKEMLDAIVSQNFYTRNAPLNKSEWIRRAIKRDIDHQRRSRRRNNASLDSPSGIGPIPGLDRVGGRGLLAAAVARAAGVELAGGPAKARRQPAPEPRHPSPPAELPVVAQEPAAVVVAGEPEGP